MLQPWKFRITGKGLSLVALPLVFELVFALALSALLLQADGEMSQEWRSRLISSELARLVFQAYGCATNAAGILLDGSDKFIAMYESNVREITKSRISLDELVSGDADRRVVLAPVQQSSEFALIKCGILALPKEGNSELERLLGSKESLTRLLYVCDELAECQSRFLAHERAIEKEAPYLRSLRRQQIQALLMVGVAMSIALCICLSIYFSSDICGRLMVIGDNVKRLREGQKLLSPVPGQDELSELDAGFHHMAGRLAESEAFKKQLVAFVSHELRTPLTSVSASLLVIESGMLGALPESALDCLKVIQNDIEDVMKLCNRLLQIEKMEAGKMQMEFGDVDLWTVFEDVFREMKDEAAAGSVQIVMPDPETCPKLRADRQRLSELIKELLANALRVSPANSSIFLRLETSDNFITIHVDDEGPGVPEELLAGIFDKFSVNDSGAGLGLALCKAVVEQHQGTLEASRRASGGSRFSITLPRFLKE